MIAVLIFLLSTATQLHHFHVSNNDNYTTTFPNFIDNTKEYQQRQQQPPPSWKPFNNTNSHLTSWCPLAQCYNSPLCTPCKNRHLFIIATGRSGSTTLLKMFNLLPNVRLSGENANTLFVASRIISNLRQNSTPPLLEQDYDRLLGAWMHNAIPKQSMACVMQHVLYALNPPPLSIQNEQKPSVSTSLEDYDANTILGMKTIRFHKGRPGMGIPPWTPTEAASFLLENFPCSRIIINVRSDLSSQLKSIRGTFVQANVTTKDEETIDDMNQFLKELDKLLPNSVSRLIDMVDWTADVGILNDLVHWMGFKNCVFQSVVHENRNGFGRDARIIDNGNGGEEVEEKNRLLGKDCHYPHVEEG